MKRVLVVEDSPVMRQLLTLAIRAFPGVTVDQAPDGVGALKALKQAAPEPYAMVFLDLNMPMMDGMKLLARMRDDPAYRATVVVVVTTEEAQETEQQARDLGARYFVRKPVNRRTIERIVADVLGPS